MTDYADLSDDELREKHDDLLRLAEQDLVAGYHEGAREMNRERQRVLEEARRRGVDL